MSSPPVKTCHYVILGVDRDADDDQLKKAYRKMALKWHPDKNPDKQEEAANQFKLVLDAYQVLSDKHERAFYDSHRESILRGQKPGGGGGGGKGGDDEHEPDPDGLNLFTYFSTSCFSDYSDTAPDGFYTVYGSIFEKLDGLEMEAQQGEPDAAQTRAPTFGISTSTVKEVRSFYAYWLNFISTRTFAFREKWNLADAQNRQIRRAMEKENNDARRTAKREYNENVRNLVRYVRKRDKRVQEYERQEKLEEQAKAVRTKK